MKQKIRLTESQLHRIIKESVNEVLKGLHGFTYANAAKKAKQRAYDAYENGDFLKHDKEFFRARDFDTAAAKALDREFGGSHSVNTEHPRQVIRNTDYRSEWPWRQDYHSRPFDDGDEDEQPYSYTGNKFNGGDEISDFVQGNYEYIKGKGWVKKH